MGLFEWMSSWIFLIHVYFREKISNFKSVWIDQIKVRNPITDGSMTRLIMSLDEAVDLVLFAFEHGQSGDILVQKAPACTIQTQAEAVCELFGGNKEDIKGY
jgi:UDP-glucose 4-epimerase